LLDLLKGVAAIYVAQMMVPGDLLLASLCGLAVISGHNWPVFFGFRGGKGIATTIGVMLTLAFLPTLYASLIAVVAIAVTRYVSLGSLLLSGLLPFLLLFMGRPSEIVWTSVVLALFAFYRHRSNIVKLVTGKENKLGKKKTDS
jgi:glycerol-3-phosphate acyltransferase PlsY